MSPFARCNVIILKNESNDLSNKKLLIQLIDRRLINNFFYFCQHLESEYVILSVILICL